MTASPVKSAQRAMEIFEFFSERKSPATLMEIARGLGYPASSASALLKSLFDMGYLTYDQNDRTFLPTFKTALLGIWINDLLIGHSTIVRLMHELRDRTGITAVLGIQIGLQVQLIQVIKSPDRLHATPVSNGSVRPLLRSAIGYVLLSLKSDREISALTRRLNAEEKDPRNRVSISELSRQIEFCRRFGYAYTEGAATRGGGMVAMLLAAPRHQLPLVLGIGAPIKELNEMKEQHISVLRDIIEANRTHMEREWGGALFRNASQHRQQFTRSSACASNM